eukprot:TRINITY_DN1333_c0_g1_i2.p1 TRINITY_DN1333_c0_g1~~TRINITY_DN1333_c0_g1_i2.p1  ORF type:complete len:1215 (-),score=439.37 TRINITY_DN1333_c0_g1_i2:120-3764(-)
MLPPHVYAVADRAYRSLKGSGRNQSIVVSGESGAGKTQSCKYVMRFFAVIAGSEGGDTSKLETNLELLESKIVQANPILEAFGNAKTLRNNNSSRFGKFTQLQFDKQFKLKGASIVTYLLEKSRVVFQAKGERNFHIFYQMLKGASVKEREKWHLGDGKPEQFTYLTASECTTVEGVDDAHDFAANRKFMKASGIGDADQEALFEVLSGLLHLGNVNFVNVISKDGKKDANTEEKVQVDSASSSSAENAAHLLGIPAEKLRSLLVTRSIVVGNKAFIAKDNTYLIQLSEQEAIYARDALVKYVYSALFEWLVAQINHTISTKDASRFIGILDISGFEIFATNSFEQFTINFANEKIQQYFNKQILQQEQEIYLLEGLKWRKVEFQDNQDVIDLIEGKRSGILALLDEECIVPKGTDKSFCAKVHTIHSGNPNLSIPHSTTKGTKNKTRLLKDEGFVVRHFAGAVCYTTKNFLDKNNDTLHHDLENLLLSSKKDVLKASFKVLNGATADDEVVDNANNRRFKSVSARFQKQLNHLMTELNSTISHFVRCIKPNELQKPGIFDGESVMTQLQYNGMCTALELMQIGFPTRISFDELYARYSPFMPPTLSKLKPVTFCEAVLVALDLHGGRDFQMGLTKVFFRAGKLQFLDELTSNSKDTISLIVGKVKKWLAAKRFRGAIHAVRTLLKLEKQLRSVRILRKWRKAARFMAKMAKVWIPLVDKVRKKILSSEDYQRRVREEEQRREEERLAEVRRQQEEERLRRERKEAKARAREEEKKSLVSKIQAEEESRKISEKELKDLVSKYTLAANQLSEEQAKNEQINLELQHVKTSTQILREHAQKSKSETELNELKMKDEIFALKAKILEEQNNCRKVQQQKFAVEKEILLVQKQYKELKDDAVAQKKILTARETEVSAVTAERNELKDALTKELNKGLARKLELEITGRTEDKQRAAEQLKHATDALNSEISAVEHLMANLKKDNERLQKEVASSKQSIKELKAEVDKLQRKKSTFASALKQLEQERDAANKKIALLESEKQGLIKTALAAQDDQRKFKAMLEKFEGKLDAFARLVYGDLAFNTILADCTRSGQVNKQGGKNKSKWQKRYLVLNGNFLMYYANTGDKDPKGIIRIDNESILTTKSDLSKLGVKHSFTVVKQDKSGRAFYFSCATEEECNEWVRVLLICQGWPTDEVNSYLEAVKSPTSNSGTLRNRKS